MAELLAATAAFAVCMRQSGVMPEGAVVALKVLFARLDGIVPSFVHHEADELRPHSPHGHWYPTVFQWCLEAYFAPEVSTKVATG